MRLWTIQPIEWYKKLCRDGIIYGEEEYIEWIEEGMFNYAYHWMIKEMTNRIGISEKKDSYPIWAWFQYNTSKQCRPDLRNSGFLPKGTKGVRIEFEKLTKDVLLSDFNLWGHVLNYWYIADDENEGNLFDRKLSNNNISFIDKKSYTTDLRKILEDSWTKIFDMDYCREYSAYSFEQKNIQATFWSLSTNEIKKVDFFTAR
ncbi:MAG: DUF3841 domain-containing protein [Marinifilum sp.]|jgi:hypothetical protein|nr:DUF3841 domain-containing protein [Marinifilum sp.]